MVCEPKFVDTMADQPPMVIDVESFKSTLQCGVEAEECRDCERSFLPSVMSKNRCDECWVRGIVSGDIGTKKRKFKRMCIGPAGNLQYLCDYCQSPMEADRPLFEWCKRCELWWQLNVGNHEDYCETKHSTAQLVRLPMKDAVVLDKDEVESQKPPREIHVTRKDEEVAVRIPQDAEREARCNQ